MYNKTKRCFWLLLVLLIVAPAVNIYADGSRNWANPGSTPTPARRAFLRSSSNPSVNWQAGERITVASSLQNTGTIGNSNKRIKLYAPSGDEIPLDFSNGGRIQDRTQELAGPHLFGTTSGGYTSAYYHVPANGEGVYRVELLSTNNTIVASSVNVTTNNFGQTPNSNTVTNTANDGLIDGRVYTNVLNLSVGISDETTTGFYGLVYVRTKDGYTYRVDNNGNNGMYFTFFVNNNGFVDSDT